MATASCDLRPPRAAEPPPAAAIDRHQQEVGGRDLDAARELDQQGVLAFEGGRYRDAMRLFLEARRLGGPPSELWNVVRCHERLDEAEEAIALIDDYLREKLANEDRAEATRERDRLRARPSILTAVSVPPGAMVSVDNQPANGVTPLWIEVATGAHTVTIRRAGYAPRQVAIEAKLGRAVIVEVALAKAGK